MLSCAIALLAPGAARATHELPSMMFEVVGGSGSTDLQSQGTATGSGDQTSWSLNDPLVIDGITLDSWSVTLKEDPFVTNNIVVTNNTGVTQTFIATVLLPIPVFNYDSVINSSIGVTVTDSNGNNVMSFANNAGTPIYQGTVNGTTIFSLNPAGMPITITDCVVSFPGCTATSAAGTAFQAVTPGAATLIGITLTFDLSAGDSAGITSRFEIVPEPSTALLLVGGLVTIAAARRRSAA